MNIKNLLNDEITNEIEHLKAMELGTETYKITVDGLTKLIDRVIDLKKIDVDSQERIDNREIENNLKIEQIKLDNELRLKQIKIDNEFKLNQIKIDNEFKEKQSKVDRDLKTTHMKNEKIDRMLYNGTAIAGIVIPSIITIWGTLTTLKFEETGTVTTMAGKGFVNRLLPRK